MKRLIAVASLMLVYTAIVTCLVVCGRSELRAADNEFRPLSLESASTDFDPLRQKYVERLKAKAELMSNEEVQQALEATDQEIRILQAKRMLDDAAKTLQAIAKEYKGTPSANLADEMLAVHGRGPSDEPFQVPSTPAQLPTY